MTEHPDAEQDERLRRWRLALGAEAGDPPAGLGGADGRMDAALAALYGAPESRGLRPDPRRGAGLESSAPAVARWLGDIREFFPSTVVQVLQQDAIDRLNLRQLLLEPEILETIEPDVHLVGTLLSLNRLMPQETKDTARLVVRKVVRDLEDQLAQGLRTAVSGALNRAARTRRPRHRDVDWNRTIRANLKNYLPEQRTVVPERLVGYARAARSVEREVVLAIDQSGSMAASVVYSALFGAVLASIRALKTSLVVFDSAVVDLTDELRDPVDVLFGTQLGGGTDINRAVAYCQSLITRPEDSILILVSDLIEGGIRDEMLRRVAELTGAGVQVIVLLALSDEGVPVYDRPNAVALAGLGVPAFACTPDLFGPMLAAAIERRDLSGFAAGPAQAR
ncbi:MAG TPA: VWA domain-containing protein [Actinocrinis sp.]|nr:VWA domain-containing protein [Actinocrinis sp.]